MDAASEHPNPLRLLHLVLSLDMGGLENLVWQMANRAAQFDLRADVACMDRGGHYADHLDPGVTVHGIVVREPQPYIPGWSFDWNALPAAGE